MKPFKYYKKEIDDKSGDILNSLRDHLLKCVDNIDFSDFDSITQSIHNNNDAEFESHNENESVIKIKIKESIYYLFYKKDNVVYFFNIEQPEYKISINLRTRLFLHIETPDASFEQKLKPKIESQLLKSDVSDFLMRESDSIDNVYIYDSHIDIDETVRASVFLFIKDKNIVFDLKGTFKFNDIRIKRLNVFRYKNEDRKKIDFYNPLNLKPEDVKSILGYFDVIPNDSIIISYIEKNGLKIIDSEVFNQILDINTLS